MCGVSSDLVPHLEVAAVAEDSGKQVLIVILLPHGLNALLIIHRAQ